MPMVYRKSPRMVEEAKKRRIGIDPSEDPEQSGQETVKGVSLVGGGMSGMLTAFTQGTSVGHGH